MLTSERRRIMGFNDYGDVFLSPESAIEAVLEARELEDDALATELSEDLFADNDEVDEEAFTP
ncbi:MAG: hypothetical protein ACKVQU_08615 [Burkholderiales bacterium]